MKGVGARWRTDAQQRHAVLTRWSASRRHFLLEWSWACCRPRADLTPWPDEKHRCGAHPAAGCQMKRTTGALPGWGLRSTGGRPSLLRSRLAVVTLSVIAAVAALTMSALPAAASRPRASAAASAVPDVAATTLTTYAGGSAVTPPQPCTSTVDFDGQEPVGPGSWCLLSWTVGLTLPGPYKPTGGGTLGDYVAHLSATAPTSVTIAVPDGGLFMGSGACEALAPGAYPKRRRWRGAHPRAFVRPRSARSRLQLHDQVQRCGGQ